MLRIAELLDDTEMLSGIEAPFSLLLPAQVKSALDSHHHEFDGKGQEDETHDPGEDLLTCVAQESPDLLRQGHGYPQDDAEACDDGHKNQTR